MKTNIQTLVRSAALALTALLATAAQAHTGHDINSFTAGLMHPVLGMDHLLAMVSVGLWSVSALKGGKVWLGPLAFISAMIVSAVLGAAGFTPPFLEEAIALSVVLFGIMLIATRVQIPSALGEGVGLGLIAVAASMHGLAHGAESSGSSFVIYALGFVLTTTILHFGGVLLGVGIRRSLAQKTTVIMAVLGSAVAATGLYLFAQV